MSGQGKVIVIEGTDSSGKETQARLLYDRLSKDGLNVKKLSFPRYGNVWATPVEHYLAGDLGKKPGDVNAEAASLMYAIDRLASFKEDWAEFYQSGGILICDRYTTSNALHQTSKLPDDKRIDFLEWLYDLEYNKMELPRPNLIFFLNVADSVAERALMQRTGKAGVQHDIHETDLEYLRRCRENGRFVAQYDHWVTINCTENDQFRTREEIHADIHKHVCDLLNTERNTQP